MPSAVRPFSLAVLLLGAAFVLPARAEEPRSQVQAPRQSVSIDVEHASTLEHASPAAPARSAAPAKAPTLPFFFLPGDPRQPDAPSFSAQLGGMLATLQRDRVELTKAEGDVAATVALHFVGAAVQPESDAPLPGKVHMMLGDKLTWRSNVATTARVRYRSLWPGVDLVVHAESGELQYDVHLAPGADLSQVGLRVEGAELVTLEGDGSMLLRTPLGELRQKPPLTWEVREDGEREVVPSAFVVRDDGSYGFRVQRTDASRPLVVDPILVWGTYWGLENSFEIVRDMEVDASGAVYIAGEGTFGSGTPGAFRVTPQNGEGFIAKLDPSQPGPAQLVWLTYIGSPGSGESVNSIALRPSGTIVASGWNNPQSTTSQPLSNLVTANAYATTGNDFLIELSADGSTLLYGTLCSFNGRNALQLEPGGVIVMAMDASLHPTLNPPTTPGAYQTTKNGPSDVWVCRFDNRLSGSAQFIWASYFGGAGHEDMSALEVSPTEPGVFTIAGYTSDAATFPSTHTTGQLSLNDVFLARFDTNQIGSAQRRFAHVYGRFSGPFGEHDAPGGIALDPVGGVWFSVANGYTQLLHFSSTGATIDDIWTLPFHMGKGGLHRSADDTLTLITRSGAVIPVTPDAVQSTFGGGADLAVVQLDPVAHQVLYATYLGGSGDEGFSTSVMRGNVLTLAGTSNGGIATVNPLQPYASGGCCIRADLYLARLELPFGQAATPGIGPRDLALLDLDGDGRLDAATANETSNNLSLRTNEGLGVFSAETTLALTASDSAPVALVRADLDNDGARDDLAVACEASSTLVLVTNPGAASPTLFSRAAGGSRASCVASGDLDGNPQDDVVVGLEGLPLAGGGGLALSLNGGALVSSSIPAPHPTQVVAVALGDLDGDGDADLAAVARGASDALLLFAGDAAGALSFAAALPLSTSGSASGLVLADLDRDGRNDLAVAQPVLFPPSQS
ncbi:MAG: VCBS repeat-containing protein, partial [Planctomycetes bacterium]|nr:VCBS repeat-containing protein [Planctomycetota bacterium]